MMKVTLLLGVVALSLLALLFIAPVPQWPEYHQFADQRAFFGVPNFFNVVSSLIYLPIGGYALLFLLRHYPDGKSLNQLASTLFYVGFILIGVASVFYHWQPDNASLFWDRLAMSLAFMSLLSYVVSVFIDDLLGRRLLFPLLGLGLGSVIYWRYTETLGHGDLRLYGLVQFLPMLLIPLILMMYGKDKPERRYISYVIALYALAKLAEVYDEPLMDLLSIVSGHSVKHVVSALAGMMLLPAFRLYWHRER